MRKTIIIVMILTVISKISGFGKDLVLAYFYGASDITDVYLISLTIPSVIFGFIGAGVSTGYIPMYSKIENDFGKKEGVRFTNNLINAIILFSTIIFIIVLVFVRPIVQVFASGFEDETLELAIIFTRISLVLIYSIGISAIFKGYLQLKGNYIVPELLGIPTNILIIIFIVISYKTNILVLSIGSTIAILSQLFIMIFYAQKEGYKYKFFLDIQDKNLKKMINIGVPVILGASTMQINQLIDRTLASKITVGGISALNYAQKLDGFIQGLFVLSITTVLYPNISKMVVKNDLDKIKKSISEAISTVNLLVLPATIGAMIFAKPIIIMLFARGAFDQVATNMTASALFYYSIGMGGAGIKVVLARVFYSFQDTKTPMITSAIAVVINIILNIILSKYLGIGGLALSTSIASIIAAALMFASLRRKIGSFGIKHMGITFVKIMSASLIMGIIAKIAYDILLRNIDINQSLIISIGMGVIVYFIIINYLNIEEVENLVDMIKNKLLKNMGNRW